MRKTLLIAVPLMLAAAFFFWNQKKSDQNEKVLAAKKQLGQLVMETHRIFQNKNEVSEEKFWKQLGSTAEWEDPWHSRFRLKDEKLPSAKEPNFHWESAGPDGMWDTSDDLVEKVWPETRDPNAPDPLV